MFSHRFSTRAALATLTLAAVSAAPAFAVTVTTADGAFGADNQIQGKSFSDRELINKGSSISMELRNNGNPANSFTGVLRFDLSTVTGPASAATLSLTLNSNISANTQLGIYALNEAFAGGGADGSDGDELSETAYIEGSGSFALTPSVANDLVGDIAPGFNELLSGTAMVIASSTLIDLIDITAGAGDETGTLLTTSSAALLAAINADTNNALVFYLFNTSNPNESFQIRTADFGTAGVPTLDVTLAAIPEPATAAVLFASFSTLLLKRRSRISQ